MFPQYFPLGSQSIGKDLQGLFNSKGIKAIKDKFSGGGGGSGSKY